MIHINRPRNCVDFLLLCELTRSAILWSQTWLAIIYAQNTRKIWNAVCLQKALYAETRKDVRIHHATLNAKASVLLLLHTAHPACARLTPNTEQINHRTNCNIPYIWIFWSHTSRGYDRARHAGKKWRGEIDHPWERGCTPGNLCNQLGGNQLQCLLQDHIGSTFVMSYSLRIIFQIVYSNHWLFFLHLHNRTRLFFKNTITFWNVMFAVKCYCVKTWFIWNVLLVVLD